MSTVADPADFAPETTEKAAPKPSRARLVAGGLGLVAALAVGAYVWSTRGIESTDDAQIDAEVVAVPARTTGVVKKILFVENQRVKTGDVLAELDDDAPKARLAQAEAALASAKAAADAAEADARVATNNAHGNKAAADASLVTARASALGAGDQIREAEATLRSAEAARAQSQSDRDRAVKLAGEGALTAVQAEQAETALALATASVDAARARLTTLRSGVAQASGRVFEAQARATQSNDVDSLVAQAEARASSARAQVATAQAARDLAALDLSYTRIVAPHDGVVSKKTIAEGQQVAAGQSIVQLVTPGVWVTANFKETQMEKLRVGEPVTFSVDAFGGAKIHGTVESVSGATGSRFSLLPPDNASGNFTKVVQRVPVRIHVADVPSSVVLRPGMSVDVHVDTKG